MFERYLAAWAALCMFEGVLIGRAFPDPVAALPSMEVSHINLPIAVLIWLMTNPMMRKVDLASVLKVGKNPRGLLVTRTVNWLVKPFSMASLGWLFFKHGFQPWIGPEAADREVSGLRRFGLGLPCDVLFNSALLFIVIPLGPAVFTWKVLVNVEGLVWFEERFLPRLHSVAIGKLLLTLVLIFAFQANNLSNRL